MKHRHRLQQQRRKPASQSRRAEVYEEAGEPSQPAARRAKKRSTLHMHAEGGRTKPRLDKFRRGGRRTKSFDDGGSAGSASTRSPNDPGGELASANRGRKSTLDWIRDEVLGGTKPAYKHGGRSKKYDAGGPAPDPTGGSPSTQDFISTPQVNPIVKFVQSNIPPNSRYLKQGFVPPPPRVAAVPTKPGVPTSILLNNKQNNKQGGRIRNNRAKEK